MRQFFIVAMVLFTILASQTGCRSCNPRCYTASRVSCTGTQEGTPAAAVSIPATQQDAVEQQDATEIRTAAPAPLIHQALPFGPFGFSL